MKTLTTFTSFLFLSSFISHSLSRPITESSASASSPSAAATAEEKYWVYRHHFFAHSPLPSWHRKRWPFVHPYMHHGGYWWSHPHALPPMVEKPWPHKEWPLADAPMPHGWKRHHRWPLHSPFPFPWWPKMDAEIGDAAADEIEAAPPA